MSAYDRHIGDVELDGLLRALVAEGAATGPPSMLEAALREVAVTPQARPRRFAPRLRFAPIPATWAVAATIVVVGAAGLVIGGRAIGPGPVATPTPIMSPSPSPSPAPSASPEPSGFVRRGSPEAGYGVQVPAAWTEATTPYGDVRRWSGPDGAFSVSYGASIFDGGAVTVCAAAIGDRDDCLVLDHGYSIPFDPDVDGTGPISLEVFLDRCAGACPLDESITTLDGEDAAYSRVVIKDRQLTYVSTFHDRRPVILYWNEPVESADEARVQAMLDSFRFVNPDSGAASPTPFIDPTELVTWTNAEDGYAIDLPRTWTERLTEKAPAVTGFGSGRGAGSRSQPAVMVSVGTPAGDVAICQDRWLICSTVTVATLDDLGAAIVAVPAEFAQAVQSGRGGDTVIGRDPARYAQPAIGHNCLGCPGLRYVAYTIHEGRPVVISLDWWMIRFEGVRGPYLQRILDSFRFLE